MVYPKSGCRHIQMYRDSEFQLCSIATRSGARQVFAGSEPKVDEMPMCEHCVREAERIVKALEEQL